MKSVETINNEQQLIGNFQQLVNTVVEVCEPAYANSIVNMLNKLAFNTQHDGNLCPGFIRAPASQAAHHSEPGGLVAHLLQMWEFSELLLKSVPVFQVLDRQAILAGIIFHDLHKASFNYTFASDADFDKTGLHFKYYNSMLNQALQKSQRSYQILVENGILLTIEQANALFGSEGGFAEAPPKATFVLSKFLYLLDELSANVFDRIVHGRMFDYKTNAGCPTFNTLHQIADHMPAVQESAAPASVVSDDDEKTEQPNQEEPDQHQPTTQLNAYALNVTVKCIDEGDGDVKVTFDFLADVSDQVLEAFVEDFKKKLAPAKNGLYTVILDSNFVIHSIVFDDAVVYKKQSDAVQHVSV